MIEIKTHRLRLLALPIEAIALLVQDRSVLEKSLLVNASQFELNAPPSFMEEFYVALQSFVIPNMAKDPDRYLWYTHWLVIHQSLNVIIGGIGAAGPPDTLGRSMIGYFIDSKFEGRGMATEAVEGFTAWMRKDPSLRFIEADTLREGVGSQKVLQKCGFELADMSEEVLHWKYRV